MKKEEFYEAPDVELIEIVLEQAIATSGDGTPGPDDNPVDLGDYYHIDALIADYEKNNLHWFCGHYGIRILILPERS